MADIDIERRKRSPWPWAIGALVLVLAVWGLSQWVETDQPTVVTTDPADDPAAPPAAVNGVEPAPAPEPAPETAAAERFQEWVRDSAEAVDRMGLEHEYTREGIDRVASTLEALVGRDPSPTVQQRLEEMRRQRQAIRASDPHAVDHANQARAAFLAAVGVLESLQERPEFQQAGLDQHVDRTRQAAEQVRPDTPLLEQRAEVHEFFSRMGDALQTAEQHYVRQ